MKRKTNFFLGEGENGENPQGKYPTGKKKENFLSPREGFWGKKNWENQNKGKRVINLRGLPTEEFFFSPPNRNQKFLVLPPWFHAIFPTYPP